MRNFDATVIDATPAGNVTRRTRCDGYEEPEAPGCRSALHDVSPFAPQQRGKTSGWSCEGEVRGPLSQPATSSSVDSEW
jgi:hypothetical protein